jgi:hypothetical protein
MGESTEERYIGILESVEQITFLASQLNPHEYETLIKHAEKLWPALRSPNCHDRMHGYNQTSDFSLSSGNITSYENPTFVAFQKVKKEYADDISIDLWDDRTNLSQWLDIDYVVNNNQLSLVINISKCIEDDNFTKRFEKVNSIVSLIEREIYLVFRDRHEVYDAWIMSNILNKVIDVFDDTDILGKFIKSNIHDFRLSEQTDGKALSECYFDKIQKKCYVDFTLTDRLEVLLTILGRRFYNIEDHKKLLESIKDQDVDVELIELCLKSCIDKRQEYYVNSVSGYNPTCYLKYM